MRWALIALLIAATPPAARAQDFSTEEVMGRARLLKAQEPEKKKRYRDEVFKSVVATKDVEYARIVMRDGATKPLLLDLYEPQGDSQEKRPVVVFAHPGAFAFGSKDDSTTVMLARGLAKYGYVTASINYRLRSAPVPVADTPVTRSAVRDAQHDAQAAVRFLRASSATYRIDVDQIAIAGWSAGGVIALCATYNADDVAAGQYGDQRSDTCAAISISGATDPALLDADEKDSIISFDEARKIEQRAKDVGLCCEVMPLDAGHEIGRYGKEITAKIADFLYRRAIQ